MVGRGGGIGGGRLGGGEGGGEAVGSDGIEGSLNFKSFR